MKTSSIVLCIVLLFVFSGGRSMEGADDGTKPSVPGLVHRQVSSERESPYHDIQLLGYLEEAELARVMAFIVESLRVQCTFCHDAEKFSRDKDPQKEQAREMIEMVHLLNSGLMKEPATCYTCHVRTRRPPLFAEGFHTVPSLLKDDTTTAEPGRYQNVQEIGHLTPEERDEVMFFFVASIGAESCSSCHHPHDLASDELQAKVRSRAMIRIVTRINPQFFGYERVTCHTCHQGRMIAAPVPEDWVPGWK